MSSHLIWEQIKNCIKNRKNSTTIKKSCITFYGHVRRIEPGKIWQDHNFSGWVKKVHQDLENYNLCLYEERDIGYRRVLRKNIVVVKDLPGENQKNVFGRHELENEGILQKRK